jgi:hypothetical protein
MTLVKNKSQLPPHTESPSFPSPPPRLQGLTVTLCSLMIFVGVLAYKYVFFKVMTGCCGKPSLPLLSLTGSSDSVTNHF